MKSVLIILLALGGIVLIDNSRATAQTPLTQVPETWLMLKNGSTFAARMLSAGERVKLRVNDGDIEIRASEIALTGYSLSDLAEQQWAILHQQQLDKQFPFVDWCARYHLYDMADAALAQMAITGQDTPRVQGYQVRLKRLREIHLEQQTAAAQLAAGNSAHAHSTPKTNAPAPAAIAPAPAVAALGSPVAAAVPAMPPQAPASSLPSSAPSLLLPVPATGLPSALPSTSPSAAVQPAAYQPLENPRRPSTTSKEPEPNSPDPALLPPAAVEVFTARVQPWVVSRCGGCHDQNSGTDYKLIRYSKQEAIPRATTLKNLAATTRLVDRQQPADSPLLVMAGRAHGTSLVPPIAAGDGAALAAFREFVALATGRELPREAKPEKTSPDSLRDLTGQVTPGRATFPASAADEPATEDKAAAVLKQTGPGWQAAIERQRALDAEEQRRKNLETNSQRANAARGLIADPAVQPAAIAAEAPPVLTPTLTTLPQQPALLRNLPVGTPLFDNDAAKAAIENQSAASVIPAMPRVESPVGMPPTNLSLNRLPPSQLPDSLLPKSLAAKPQPEGEALSQPREPLPSTTIEKQTPLPVPYVGKIPAGAIGPNDQPSPPVKIDLKRQRRQFPLPPEDKPPSKGVGTGETKQR